MWRDEEIEPGLKYGSMMSFSTIGNTGDRSRFGGDPSLVLDVLI